MGVTASPPAADDGEEGHEGILPFGGCDLSPRNMCKKTQTIV